MLNYKTKKKRDTRKKIKKRFITTKNTMRKYPDCVIADGIYCDHVFDPEHPWAWVDFRFFHTAKKRYFAVAMTTAEYSACEEVEEEVFEKADYPQEVLDYNLYDEEYHPKYGKVYRQKPLPQNLQNQLLAYFERRNKLLEVEMAKPRTIECKIEIQKYSNGVTGVIATVDASYLDPEYVENFVKMFRALGEPMKHGEKYNVKTIQVIPQNIKRRAQNAQC